MNGFFLLQDIDISRCIYTYARCIYTYVLYIYVYTYTYTHIYVYKYMYIYTHKHTYINTFYIHTVEKREWIYIHSQDDTTKTWQWNRFSRLRWLYILIICNICDYMHLIYLFLPSGYDTDTTLAESHQNEKLRITKPSQGNPNQS